MKELHRRNIKGKLYTDFEMDKYIRIKVKTAVGTSDSSNSRQGVMQGSVDGAIFSSNDLDGGIEEAFADTG